MSPDELEEVVCSLLEEGVPPTVIARALELEPSLVKFAQQTVRVKRYGTDDITEYNEQLMWDAIERAREVIAHGSATERDRLLQMVLGKQIAVSARRTPEKQQRAQETLLETLANMRTGDAQTDADEPSPFIARLGIS